MEEICLFEVVEKRVCDFDPLCYFLPRNGFFRGKEKTLPHVKESGDNVIRIICVGNSTTYGLAVEYPNSWPILLENLLRDKYPHAKIEVLNAGIIGATPRQIKRVFQLHLINYNPDIVIWRAGARLDDFYEVPVVSSHARMLVWRVLYELRIFRVFCLINDLVNTGKAWFETSTGDEWRATTANRIWDYLMGWDITDVSKIDANSDFQHVQRIAESKGVKHVLAVDYIERHDNGTLESDYIMHKELGLDPVVKTMDAFTEALEQFDVNEIFIDSEHMTEIGTNIIAQEVFRFLVAGGYIDSCLNGEKTSQ
ncbi:SGNH/GDSL hydrolase family protein [Candidatus Omnitrophota bacterium]